MISGAFSALNIANSSLGFHQTWLDALSHNIANLNTARATSEDAYRAQMTLAAEDPTGGVTVAGIELGNAEGRLTYAPEHPLADDQGYIRLPDMDAGSQMTELVMAQRGFQASVQVTRTAQETYAAALSIGA